MSFDLIVLVLSVVGLVTSPGRSSLWQLLFVQGASYFIVAFSANTLAAVSIFSFFVFFFQWSCSFATRPNTIAQMRNALSATLS